MDSNKNITEKNIDNQVLNFLKNIDNIPEMTPTVTELRVSTRSAICKINIDLREKINKLIKVLVTNIYHNIIKKIILIILLLEFNIEILIY